MCIMTHVAHTAFLLDSDARWRKGPGEETGFFDESTGFKMWMFPGHNLWQVSHLRTSLPSSLMWHWQPYSWAWRWSQNAHKKNILLRAVVFFVVKQFKTIYWYFKRPIRNLANCRIRGWCVGYAFSTQLQTGVEGAGSVWDAVDKKIPFLLSLACSAPGIPSPLTSEFASRLSIVFLPCFVWKGQQGYSFLYFSFIFRCLILYSWNSAHIKCLMNELSLYEYLLKTWMCQVSAGLQAPYAEQDTGPALKMFTAGNETVTRPR